MKSPALLFVLISSLAGAAETPSSLEFKARQPELPPLALGQAVPPGGDSLALEKPALPSIKLWHRVENLIPPASAPDQKQARGNMPIIAPREGITYHMPVKTPDPKVDYKLLVINPDGPTANVSAPAATVP